MECWSNGYSGLRSPALPAPITPLLHYSPLLPSRFHVQLAADAVRFQDREAVDRVLDRLRKDDGRAAGRLVDADAPTLMAAGGEDMAFHRREVDRVVGRPVEDVQEHVT